MLSREGYAGRIDLMSFGMPRIGNHAFSKYFDVTVRSKWRVVNQKDLVPRLPPRLVGYRHSVREVWFPNNVRDFKICDGTVGDDLKCSVSVKLPVPWDYHVNYLGL
jgi:predicted lipase